MKLTVRSFPNQGEKFFPWDATGIQLILEWEGHVSFWCIVPPLIIKYNIGYFGKLGLVCLSKESLIAAVKKHLNKTNH